MKLEMTLPERPGLLHAIPILNIFALMQLFFLLGPAMVTQSGVAVDLPLSKFQMERYQDTLVVTLGQGESAPRIHFGRDPVTKAELSQRLDILRENGAQTKAIVLIQTDAGTPVGIEREVTELVMEKGFRVALVGKSTPGSGEIVPEMRKK